MKLQYILLALAAGCLGVTGCRKEANELDHHHHDHEAEHNHPVGHVHGEHDEAEEATEHEEGVIVLDPHVAHELGVEVDTATLAPFANAVKVSGLVTASSEGNAVISAPKAGILRLRGGIDVGSAVKAGASIGTISADAVSGGDANRAAKVDVEAAQAEFDRVSALYADRLVTLAQYNAAKAALERARAAYSAPAAGGHAISPISGVITSLLARSGQYVETGATIATVGASGRLTLRADVPFAQYKDVASAQNARIVVPATGTVIETSSLDGRRTDAGAAGGAASGGYVPVTFSLRNDGSLIPGSAVEVYLLGDGSQQSLTVPAPAITEQQGMYFVFVRLDEDCYRKVAVTTGRSNGSRVEILSGLKGGEEVVSQGVTAVKLAAASGQVPEGHSHSH